MNFGVVLQIFQADQEKLRLQCCFVQVALSSLRWPGLADFCSWHLPQHGCDLRKHTHNAKITPRSTLTAGRQNVILIFILPADIWTYYKYDVYRTFVFLYKSSSLLPQA